jgi:hypothetical protein
LFLYKKGCSAWRNRLKNKIGPDSTTSSGACQTIVNDVMFSLPKSSGEVPYLEKQIKI